MVTRQHYHAAGFRERREIQFANSDELPHIAGARIDLVHANLPAAARATVNKRAWTKLYWTPWQAYLTLRGKARR